jgi:Asp-tRNA(Asn)/Glu-tRNA(Gln) amidotransferase A subunit family amidase
MSQSSAYLSVTEAQQRIKSGDLTVTTLVQDHIARYEERDDSVHAWAFLDKDRALAEAARLDAIPENERGVLHGVIIGVKDMMSGLYLIWKGSALTFAQIRRVNLLSFPWRSLPPTSIDMPTEHNSAIYKDNQPSTDAGAVAICRTLGALIYGKTVSIPLSRLDSETDFEGL